jgi:hypothetical protein
MLMNTKLAAYIIFCLCLLAIYQTIKLFRKDVLTVRLLLLWVTIWISIAVLSLFPSLLDFFRQHVNMGDRPFFVTTGAIMVLFVMIFYLSSALASTRKNIVKLTREVAVLQYKTKKLVQKTRSSDQDEYRD